MVSLKLGDVRWLPFAILGASAFAFVGIMMAGFAYSDARQRREQWEAEQAKEEARKAEWRAAEAYQGPLTTEVVHRGPVVPRFALRGKLGAGPLDERKATKAAALSAMRDLRMIGSGGAYKRRELTAPCLADLRERLARTHAIQREVFGPPGTTSEDDAVESLADHFADAMVPLRRCINCVPADRRSCVEWDAAATSLDAAIDRL